MGRITAVILCGGEGTRIRPLLGDLPKCLAPVAGKPFLSYICDYLYKQGVRDLVFCARMKDKNHWLDHADSAYGKHKKGFTISGGFEILPKGTGHALRGVLPLIETELTLVLNGDTFCKFNLLNLVYFHEEAHLNPLTFLTDQNGISSGMSIQSPMVLKNLSMEELKDFRIRQKRGLGVKGPPFLDIGTPEGLSKAESFLREVGVI